MNYNLRTLPFHSIQQACPLTIFLIGGADMTREEKIERIIEILIQLGFVVSEEDVPQSQELRPVPNQ